MLECLPSYILSSFSLRVMIIIVSRTFLFTDYIKEGKIGRTCNMHGIINSHKILEAGHKGTNPLGRICILKKEAVMMRTRFNCVRIGSSGGLLCTP